MAIVQGLPERVEISGKIYKLTIFLVHSKYRDGVMGAGTAGTPRLVSLIKDGSDSPNRPGDEYFACYVPEVLIRE